MERFTQKKEKTTTQDKIPWTYETMKTKTGPGVKIRLPEEVALELGLMVKCSFIQQTFFALTTSQALS